MSKVSLKDLAPERVDTKEGIAARWRIPYYDAAGVKKELYLMMIADPHAVGFDKHIDDAQKQLDIAIKMRERDGCRFVNILNGDNLTRQ